MNFNGISMKIYFAPELVRISISISGLECPSGGVPMFSENQIFTCESSPTNCPAKSSCQYSSVRDMFICCTGDGMDPIPHFTDQISYLTEFTGGSSLNLLIFFLLKL